MTKLNSFLIRASLMTTALLATACTGGFRGLTTQSNSAASVGAPSPSPSPSPMPMPSPVSVASASTSLMNSLQYPLAGFTLTPGQTVSLSDGTTIQLTSSADLQVTLAGSVLWHSASSASCSVSNACSAVFQNDGNFVVYAGSSALWSSATYSGAQALVFSDSTPYLQILSSANQVLWSSGGAPSSKAYAANDFLNSLGVNIHTDQGYDPNTYVTPLQYLGVRNVRDGAGNVSGLIMLYQKAGVRSNIGTYYDLNGSISAGHTLASAGALLSIEGPNEPNNFTGTYNGQPAGGSNWSPVAQYQSDLNKAVKADSALSKYPVFNVSETGAETTNVGLQFATIPTGAGALFADGTKFADYVNVHNYVSSTQNVYKDNMAWSAADPTLDDIWDGMHAEQIVTWNKHFNGYSPMAAVSAPRVTTETGWDSVSLPGGEASQGVVLTNTFLAQFKRGWRYTFIYELIDGEGGGGNQGLFHTDYSAKTSAKYIHNMTAILADPAANSNLGTVAYSLSGNTASVHDLLLQKSNGTYELIIWGESTSTTSNVTVNFGATHASVKIYDITLGTTPSQTLSGVSSATLQIKDHALILEFN